MIIIITVTCVFVEYFLGKLSDEEKRGLKTPLCRTPVSDLLQFAAQFLPPTSSTQYDPVTSLTLSHFQTPHSTLPAGGYSSAYAITYPSTSTAAAAVVTLSTDPVSRRSDPEPQHDETIGKYPPMPAAAQHVSVVQERILKDSSTNLSPENGVLTPDQAARSPEENRGKQVSSSRRSRVVARFTGSDSNPATPSSR